MTSPRRSITLPADFPDIVVLCGSTRYVDEFNRYRKSLTEQGHIVLAIEIVTTQAAGQDPQHVNPELKARLDQTHLRKIDLADWVFIVTGVTGYFGESTTAEIRYAVAHGKPVWFSTAAAHVRATEAGLIPDLPARCPATAEEIPDGN